MQNRNLKVLVASGQCKVAVAASSLRLAPQEGGGGPDPPEVTARERKRSQRQSISSWKVTFSLQIL